MKPEPLDLREVLKDILVGSGSSMLSGANWLEKDTKRRVAREKVLREHAPAMTTVIEQMAEALEGSLEWIGWQPVKQEKVDACVQARARVRAALSLIVRERGTNEVRSS